MDFSTEIRQYMQNLDTQIAQQLVKIERLRRQKDEVDSQIAVINTTIASYQQTHATTLETITTKKQLILAWQQSIIEHETKLKANESIVANYIAIERELRAISQSLIQLDKKQNDINQEIATIHQEFPYTDLAIRERLQAELEHKLEDLAAITKSIAQLTELETQLHGLLKLLLDLLTFFGWRSDPKADEQKKLDIITAEIEQITDSINQIASVKEILEQLSSEQESLHTAQQNMLEQQQAIRDLASTKQAISESKQTIKHIKAKIAETNQECKILTKKMHDPSYERTIAPLDRLILEAETLASLLKGKEQVIDMLNNAEHITHREQFTTQLLDTIQKRAEYFQNKQSNSTFFKSAASDPNNIANHNAYARLVQAIRAYAKNLPEHHEERRILSNISSKLLLWQIAENTKHTTMSLVDRQRAHADIQAELQALIAELPIDNPLKAAQGFIDAITSPQSNTEAEHNTKELRSGQPKRRF